MILVRRIVTIVLLSSITLFGQFAASLNDHHVSPSFGRLLELEQAYSALQDDTCSKILPKVPVLPTDVANKFMSAYQKFTGNASEEGPVLNLASQLLSLPDVEAFLSLPDSFAPGGLDYLMVQCAVLTESTPKGLAEFAVQGTAEKALVDRLLDDTILMRDMLVAGGAKEGKYPEAMKIYEQLVKASEVIGNEKKVANALNAATPWDDRNQSTVLHRFALGMAVEHAVPVPHRWGSTKVDPVQRYLNYERAYLAGDLDPAFEVLTAFECRYVSASEATEDDLAWMRETMGNYRPDHIVTNDYHWRYARAVRTDVAYGHSVWPDGYQEYRAIPAAGGECGARAWFGRFNRRAFGLPVWGIQQPGHAALTTWSPNGWVVLLGSSWDYSYWQGRGGPDFYLETQCREFRMDFQKVLRGQWVAHARGDKPVDPNWTPRNPATYGKGGLWSALMLYDKKLITVNGTVPRPIGKSVVETKVERLIKRWPDVLPPPNITVGPDGTITIPAVAFTAKNKSAQITVMKSFYKKDGQQLLHQTGDEISPEKTSFEYDITVDEAGTRFLTANISSWHMNQDLLLFWSTYNASAPVYYTVGFWNQTQPIAVKLVKGKNKLRFMRRSGTELAIKEFFVYKTKPDIPPPPKNHTPGPPPPPLDKYIELSAGKTCESQGILPLTEKECSIACTYFGFKYTGARNRDYYSGCFVLESGEWKGNGNFNSNTSAICCDPDARAVCLRK